MNKYETIANEVVKNIGGTENIESVTNCMTRLRFTLKNVSKVDVESLEKVKVYKVLSIKMANSKSLLDQMYLMYAMKLKKWVVFLKL